MQKKEKNLEPNTFLLTEKEWLKTDGVEKKRHFVGWHFPHIDILSVTYWLATRDWERECMCVWERRCHKVPFLLFSKVPSLRAFRNDKNPFFLFSFSLGFMANILADHICCSCRCRCYCCYCCCCCLVEKKTTKERERWNNGNYVSSDAS